MYDDRHLIDAVSWWNSNGRLLECEVDGVRGSGLHGRSGQPHPLAQTSTSRPVGGYRRKAFATNRRCRSACRAARADRETPATAPAESVGSAAAGRNRVSRVVFIDRLMACTAVCCKGPESARYCFPDLPELVVQRRRRGPDGPHDAVRLEIASALKRKIRFVAVFWWETRRYRLRRSFPQPFGHSARRQAHELSDKGWGYDSWRAR
jgi:hypothetical protein